MVGNSAQYYNIEKYIHISDRVLSLENGILTHVLYGMPKKKTNINQQFRKQKSRQNSIL